MRPVRPEPAARREIQTSRPTKRSVGPKLKSSVWRSERGSSGGFAFTTTRFEIRRPSSPSSANAGRSVSNFALGFGSSLAPGFRYETARLKEPSIVSPRELTSATLPAATCWRKYVYGTATRFAWPDGSSETMNQLRTKRPSKTHQKRRPPGMRSRCIGSRDGGSGAGVPSTRQGTFGAVRRPPVGRPGAGSAPETRCSVVSSFARFGHSASEGLKRTSPLPPGPGSDSRLPCGRGRRAARPPSSVDRAAVLSTKTPVQRLR